MESTTLVEECVSLPCVKARRMVEPDINEISGVDHPAHLAEGWLMLKSRDASVLAQAEAVSKGRVPSDNGSTQMELSQDARAALPADAVAYIESLEKASKKVKKSKRGNSDDTARAEFEKAIESLPEAAREVLRKSQRETAEAKNIAKSLFDTQEDAKYEAFAKSLAHVPGITVESAKDFRKVAETDPAMWEQVSKSLTAAENALAQSPLFKELGSGHSGTPGTASETIESMAKSLQESDSALTYPEALAAAAERAGRENPELITRHRREQLAANATPGE
jgi:hypothetical protein